MNHRRSHRETIRVVVPIVLTTLPLLTLASARVSRAVPLYSRRFNVPCETCHDPAPRLNNFGLAFQANHFRWPGGPPPERRETLAAIPISAMATASSFDSLTARSTRTDFNTLELFASDGFALGGKESSAGYFIDDVAYVNHGVNGNLANAFVSLPLAGANGQLALTAGQFSPMSYQYDPINSLTRSLPAALSDGVDAFTFTDTNPGVRLEYYDRRNTANADGNYAAIGVPFDGHLSLNNESRLYDTTRGAYASVFHRWGGNSVGFFGYDRSSNHQEGLMATWDLGEQVHLLGIGAAGHDAFGNSDRLSLQADYVLNPSVAVTGRLESVRGEGFGQTTYPVAAVTYYPFSLRIIRLTAETIQAKGNRSAALYLFGQY